MFWLCDVNGDGGVVFVVFIVGIVGVRVVFFVVGVI